MRSMWLASAGRLPAGAAVLIAILAAVLLAPMLGFRFQRDQAHFAYVADLWNQGLLPYVHSNSHQWPGQHVLYRLIFWLFGTTEVAVRATDIVLHIVACSSLAMLTARFTRPLTGLLAAALFAVFYVQLGPWSTANRETYQIALLLPVVFWLLRKPLPDRWDRVVSFVAGAVVALVFLIKPTIGLAVLVLIGCVLSPVHVASVSFRRNRVVLATAGALCVVAGLLVLFRSHAATVYASLISYNVSVYSQVPPMTGSRWAVLGLDLERGSFLAPVAFFLIPSSLRPVALRLIVLQLAMVTALVVQGQGFSYHLSLTMPLNILWGAIVLDAGGVWIVRQFPRGRLIDRGVAGAGILLLAACLPLIDSSDLRDYREVWLDPSVSQGRHAPIWDATVDWIRREVKQDERVCIIGLDSGVQFLAGLKPCSMHTIAALDLRDPDLMTLPLVRQRRRAFLEDLQDAQPTWILVAGYDSSWFSRSAADSLGVFPKLREFLLGYSLMNRNEAYAIFKRG